MVSNVCACCLKEITDYPDTTVYCSECRSMRRRISNIDQFTLIRIIETSRPDIEVKSKTHDHD